MSNVKAFNQALQAQVESMGSTGLFIVDIDSDTVWNTYLDSFNPGDNEIHVERREHDCNCCRQFMRDIGRVVTIVDGALVSVFDITTDDHYQPVADALSAFVKGFPIKDQYRHQQVKIGSPVSHQQLPDGSVRTWDHLSVVIPREYKMREVNIPTYLSKTRGQRGVYKRSMVEMSLSAAEVVLELIEQGTLYRGDEHKATVQAFITHKKKFDKVATEEQDNFCWSIFNTDASQPRFHGTVIGTLITDISEGTELDVAVTKYEVKVAPTNYKRPKALVTAGMIKKAEKTVESLGIQESLHRRYAVTEDITINNVLFADRSAQESMGVFGDLLKEAKVNTKALEKVEEISVDDFLEHVVPTAESIELMMENKHQSNLMSLIAPVHADSPNILKWDNNFSWSYAGDVTDSIKERVKSAGGAVDGHLRCSLAWHNGDDLDIHLIEPCGNRIYYSRARNSRTGGNLDVDMNAGGSRNDKDPVENITYPDARRIAEGKYVVKVNQYSRRSTSNVGYTVEIECDGSIHTFTSPKSPTSTDIVVEFTYSKKDGITVTGGIKSQSAPVEEWGITSQSFTKVNMIMNSPNHWDGESTGNKHVFFILDGAAQEGKARGFYNEFLSAELQDDRKVFEVLGNKLKAEESDNQLTGLGFSSTQRNTAFVKVTGAFTRTLKVNF